ncbi:hypothetical protein Ddye_030404 [Dipteronia dyeriana]|uniref:Reverse transcriptase domain-containing protein n=1 Tax=Dipteronia dyeriana TaxID=168575 RepID=A0AAD9WMH5_9ROSI|nr:hypothetical protein Ddye_030404 [Dipteronia dyeriana]
MPVWVRLSKLPIEWIDADLLRSIGGMLGTTFKVDPITEMQARGDLREFVLKLISKSRSKVLFLLRTVISRDPYGPWLQVLYERNGRYMRAGYVGKKSNSQTSSGKVGLGRKYRFDATDFVAESSRQSKDLGKKPVDISNKGLNNGRSGSNNNMVVDVVTGSRFDVLSEKTDDEGTGLCTHSRAGFWNKNQSKCVLAEIYNRKLHRKNHQNVGPSEYLVNPPLEKSFFNKPFKENISSAQQSNFDSALSVDEVIEDTEVFQFLHKDIMIQVKQSDSNTVASVVDVLMTVQVNVTNANDFEMVAFNLNEAMEGAGKKGFSRIINDIKRGPWLVIGDFNEITNSSEKKGDRHCYTKTGSVEWIDANNLIDLSFIGQRFTWVAKRGTRDDIWESLLQQRNGDVFGCIFKERGDYLLGCKKLFSTHPDVGDYSKLPRFFPGLDANKAAILNNDISEEEVNARIFGFGVLKALGPDGIPVVFSIISGRPISLCNTTYKLISKVIVQRLRNLLPDNISSNQVAFVPGRQIQDNIVVAHEALHKFKTIKGKKGLVAWKIDLANAYDKIQWGFIRQVLMEAGIKVFGQGLNVSYLFFADDFILFGHAIVSQAITMKDCLDTFCGLFGQQVSCPKSRVFCSNNVRESDTRLIAGVCDSPLTKDLGKYLGVPLVHGRVGAKTYDEIMEKMKKQLATWKCEALSLFGRATLIKSVTSVTSVLPIYAITWKAIVFGSKLIIKGLKWRVGSGATIRFWTDDLVPDVRVFEAHASGSLGVDDLNLCVDSFMVNGEWSVPQLVVVYPWNIVHRIISIHTGKMYSGYAELFGVLIKVLTNAQRVVHGMTTNSSCRRCNSGVETIDYLLLGCRVSVDVWASVARGSTSSATFNGDLKYWFLGNLRNSKVIINFAKDWLKANGLVSARDEIVLPIRWLEPIEG